MNQAVPELDGVGIEEISGRMWLVQSNIEMLQR
jgi:hypothetical protein